MEEKMARPLRVEYPNACYHIINRGNRRERVFLDDSDLVLFLDRLTEYAELYEVVIHSYCLMPNHFHLQLKTRLANLGKFMQSFITSFTLSMNRKYMKSGHLFQGRYKAQLIEGELYKNKLSRYIHLNPVKTKASENSKLAEIRKHLHDYKWSSFRSYIGIERKPKWLDRNHVLVDWGKSAVEKMHAYRKYVEDGIKTDNSEDLISSEISNIIGSDSFKDRIVRKYLIRDVSDIDEREQPELAAINTLSVKDILNVVSDYFGIVDINEILVRRGCNPDARKVSIFLAGKHCRRKEPLTSIAGKFGIKISGLNTARDKFAIQMKSDRLLKKKVKDIEKILNSKE